MRIKIMLGIIGIVLTLAIAVPSSGVSMNFARAWETLSGARWNGYVQIQASFRDNGRHARRGFHRFTREAGPALDTGRLYTTTATSTNDTTIRSRQDSVWDFPLWGDRYTTRYNWNFEWF